MFGDPDEIYMVPRQNEGGPWDSPPRAAWQRQGDTSRDIVESHWLSPVQLRQCILMVLPPLSLCRQGARPPAGGFSRFMRRMIESHRLRRWIQPVFSGPRHALSLARFEVAVLMTADSDLVLPIEIVRKRLGLVVGVLNPRGTLSRRLQQVASFYRPLRDGVLKASQFPNTLTDRKGIITKPHGW
jgi:hypothetical protein